MISNNKERERQGMFGSVGDFVQDVASLAELQLELFKVDWSEGRRKLAGPAVAILIGLFALAGCFPVVLLALAAVLHQLAGISIAASLGFTALAGVIIATSIVGLAMRGLKRALASFERSAIEFNRNVNWIKQLNR